jgi:FG-GAP-like repeat/FG-GAP repeat
MRTLINALTMRRVLLVTMLVSGVTVAVSSSRASGSPQLSWTDHIAGWDRSSSPTIADVNGDGVPEIVVGHQDGYVRVLNPATGASLAHWPRPAIVSGSTPTAIDSSPAVADLDHNGRKEIIVTTGSTWVRNQQGGLVVFNADGSTRCRMRTIDNGNIWDGGLSRDGYADGNYSSPAVGDVNGDGYPDIVWGSFDERVHAVDRFCHELPGFPFMVGDSIWSSPALADVTGAGRMDILIGGDQTAGGQYAHQGGEFLALAWTGSGVKQLWRHDTNDTVWSSPALGDIDGDGRLDVVVGVGDYWHGSDHTKVFAWHADDGSALGGWPINTGGSTMPSPALGDVTGDGVPEVAITSWDGVLRVFRGNGQLLWQRALPAGSHPGGPIEASPIVADMNGDGRNDIGVGNNWGFFVLDGASGRQLAALGIESYEAAGAVGNFGAHGWKLVVAGFNTPLHTTTIQAFAIPKPGVTPPWPMFHQSAQHLGGPVARHLLPPGHCTSVTNPPSHPIASSSHGYWVLGLDGAVYALHGAPYLGGINGRLNGGLAVGIIATSSGHGYYIITNTGVITTFGDARSFGSMAGRALNAPIISLAPTPSGRGYWLLARDGGIFSFGDAHFYGSMGGHWLNKPIISMAATRRGHGYYLLASDGGIFSFGDAHFYGSTGGRRLNKPIISMATSPRGLGYWLVGSDGGVFSFHVPFYGSLPGTGLCQTPPTKQMRPTLTGNGYFVLSTSGAVYTFGDAQYGGSAPTLTALNPAWDLAIRP